MSERVSAGPPARLFRGHVPDGPQEPARGGLGHGGRFHVHEASEPGIQAGQPEIQDFHLPVPGEEQVLRLDVPVTDALLVGRREPPGHLHGDVQGPSQGQRPLREPVAQGLPLKELVHGVEDPAVLPHVEEGDDVGVREGGHGAGLPCEALACLARAGQVLGKDLECHLASQAGVLGTVHLAHTA